MTYTTGRGDKIEVKTEVAYRLNLSGQEIVNSDLRRIKMIVSINGEVCVGCLPEAIAPVSHGGRVYPAQIKCDGSRYMLDQDAWDKIQADIVACKASPEWIKSEAIVASQDAEREAYTESTRRIDEAMSM